MKFKAGVSGNPNGRPRGSGKRQQLFDEHVWPHKEKLCDTAIQLALSGNEAMLRLILERIFPPKPKTEPLNIKLPSSFSSDEDVSQAVTALFNGANEGGITTDQLNDFLNAIKTYKLVLTGEDLHIQIQELRIALEEIKTSKINQ